MSDRIAVISAGTVRQVGTPWDIYDRPAERFVAEFIGETNFLEAEVLSVSGNKARLRLCSGAVICATYPDDLTPKGKVAIAIRPEHARLGPPGSGVLEGVLDDLVYLGTDNHFHVKVDGGGTFIVRQQNAKSGPCGFSRQERVGIAVNDDVARILKD